MTHTKEHYEKIIAEAKAGLAALESKPKKPLKGQEYWFVDADGDVEYYCWGNDRFDNKALAMGNAFSTEDAAERHAKWLKLHTAMMRASDGCKLGRCWPVRAWNDKQSAYAINYYYTCPNTPYFDTRERAEQAVNDILGGDAEFYLTYQPESL